MCIRDSTNVELAKRVGISPPPCLRRVRTLEEAGYIQGYRCLLYTSDAADERSSVDLGGRRIIKKKKIRVNSDFTLLSKQTHRRKRTKSHVATKVGKKANT